MTPGPISFARSRARSRAWRPPVRIRLVGVTKSCHPERSEGPTRPPMIACVGVGPSPAAQDDALSSNGDRSMTQQLERDVQFLKRYAIVTTAMMVVGCAAAFKHSASDRVKFTEIDVERINVMEPDGKYRI